MDHYKPKEKKKIMAKKSSNLKLDDEALKIDFQNEGPKTLQPS